MNILIISLACKTACCLLETFMNKNMYFSKYKYQFPVCQFEPKIKKLLSPFKITQSMEELTIADGYPPYIHHTITCLNFSAAIVCIFGLVSKMIANLRK